MTTTFTPNLMTTDVNNTVKFYRDRLGFNLVMGVPFDSETPVTELLDNISLQYAMLSKQGAMIMFQHQRSLAKEYDLFSDIPVAASATFYLEVESLDDLKAGLGDDVEIALPERITFYGMRELWIRDNNGYVITLAQKN